MYSVVIVDDEPLSRRGVSARLADHPDMVITKECCTGEEAIQTLAADTPDILFLDVQLPTRSGIDVLKSLAGRLPPAVIFITAFSHYAIDAFDVHAVDYLMKPIDDDRFTYALNRARTAVSSQRTEHDKCGGQAIKRFAVRDKSRVSFIDVPMIDWVEAVGDYTALHTKIKTHLLRETITSVASKLSPEDFIRIHRSAIVQVDRIINIEALPNRDCRITLRGGERLRVSRTFSSALWQVLDNRRPGDFCEQPLGSK
jgi:two-component system, LytTR family, response regulator